MLPRHPGGEKLWEVALRLIAGEKHRIFASPFYAMAPFLLLIIKTSIEMRNVQDVKT